ncbi:Arc family DNA-binding protein [Corynebacterium nasicanis]|uniref:Arc family DNA-binding protein n=1 Tax=Corynebacterium nasicanis TaxID=1448267 RepID=A0ABW1QGH6_9CORY
MSRKNLPLRLDPAVHEAIARWARDETRSVNAQIELMLRDALRRAGRLPRHVGELPKRGRPPKV